MCDDDCVHFVEIFIFWILKWWSAFSVGEMYTNYQTMISSIKMLMNWNHCIISGAIVFNVKSFVIFSCTEVSDVMIWIFQRLFNLLYHNLHRWLSWYQSTAPKYQMSPLLPNWNHPSEYTNTLESISLGFLACLTVILTSINETSTCIFI